MTPLDTTLPDSLVGKIHPERWRRFIEYNAWKETRRGRWAMRLYPWSHRAYLYLARKDGWAK